MENEFFPWVNPWRAELRSLLEAVPVARGPALRRSLKADYLFSTDLPFCASEENCEIFVARAEQTGWSAQREGRWIHLQRADASLPPGWFPEGMDGEADCLRALLRRHPRGGDPLPQVTQLLKAREEGPQSWEKACREVHQDWACRLRQRLPLPDLMGEE